MNYELEQPYGPGPAHLYCSTGPITWAATLRPPQVAPVTPGSYQGQTENGNPVFLTVRSDRTFTGWLVVDDLPNNCLYPPAESGSSTPCSASGTTEPSTLPSWDGSIIAYEGGELTHWEGIGSPGGSTRRRPSRGTIVMNYTLEDQGVGRLPCSSRYMTWSATLRT